MKPIDMISREMNLEPFQVSGVAALLEQGASIPFIARYRKEKTGSLDEVVIAAIRDRINQLDALEQRKTAIRKSMEEREILTPILSEEIEGAVSVTELEDWYEKYRPKKRTRAQVAREKGLEPLAGFLFRQTDQDPFQEARSFVDRDRVETIEDALSGAMDIIAEGMAEDAGVRSTVRRFFTDTAMITSRVKKGREKEGVKYSDYFDWSEKAFAAPSHRILAMFRGRNEQMLSVHVLPDEEKALGLIERRMVKKSGASAAQVKAAVKDGYKRLLSKSIETECMGRLKEKADETAVAVFAGNLKELLLAAPLGRKRILAIDPGFRTGCKLVCLDEQGKLLHHDLIFPFQERNEKAKSLVRDLAGRFNIHAVAVGNGTAGRETEAFVRGLGLAGVDIVMVDESGASIYSASAAAREEFPDQDITVRGAVSIGRRLLDPLAELVKLDPGSIGVGQYQHDVDQKLLQNALDDTIIFCVNRVGVDVNTASRELLRRVSGLNDGLAANLIQYRNENGPFRVRRDFLKVPRLGPRAFEQAAGFLRIPDAENPLDRSGIHPESYGIVEKMARDLGVSVDNLMMNEDSIKGIRLSRYLDETIGMPTLEDIRSELLNPGRDPRNAFEVFSFDETIHDIKDLIPGMTVPGIVTNVTAFGAFVDIGVHQDGLVHISQLADRFVKDPNEIVKVRQKVLVRVLETDVARKRISLSMKKKSGG